MTTNNIFGIETLEELINALQTVATIAQESGHTPDAVNVNMKGVVGASVHLQEETLSDGSTVFDVTIA